MVAGKQQGMSHIFISYSRKDLMFAEQVINALAKDDLEPWIDWKSIPKGEEFWREIQQGIEEAETFLFLVSPDSAQSEWCSREIDHAVKNGKRLLPIIIRDTDSKILHPEISKRNWIFCRDGQDDFNKAIEETRGTIHTDYEWLKYHTELQVKALKWEQKRDNSQLLRGRELREAEQQLTSTAKDPQPTDLQRQYILAARRSEEKQRRRITTGLVFGLLAVAAIAGFAIWQWRRADEQARISRAGELIAQAQTQLDRNPDFALLLSIEAYRREDNWNTRNGLFTILQSDAIIGSIQEYLTGHSEYVNDITFSPDGTILASASQDSTVRLWNTIMGQPMYSPLLGHAGGVTCLVFSPDGMRLASGSWDQSIRLWNVKSAGSLDIVLNGHSGGITALAFSSDGRTLVSSSEDNTIRLWDLDSEPPTDRILLDGVRVLSLAFSPDGETLAAASEENSLHTIRLWNAKSLEQGTPLLGHSDWITAIAFSPDSKTLASGSADQTIRIWDVATQQQVDTPLTGFTDWVSSFAFSPDGKFLISGSWDRSIRLWDLVSHRSIGNPIMEHRNWVTSVAFSPDGKTIASSSKDNTLRLWPLGPAGWVELACERSGRNLTHEEWAQYLADEPYRATCPQWTVEP